MKSIHEIKRQEVADTPILLFDCELTNGEVVRWSTHRVRIGEYSYQARVLRHNLFEMRAMSDDSVDGIAKISVVLANADGDLSQRERSVGWKGARLRVSFVFYDLAEGEPTSAPSLLFRGAANAPEEITEATFTLTFSSRFGLQRTYLPQIRIQRHCPWTFPVTVQQREEAASVNGDPYDARWRCGYSADVPGGVGNLDGGTPFTACDFSRS